MFEGFGLLIPDLWQQEAVRALQQGRDVVVQAPTGAGKTFIFELLYPNLKRQAIYTVPTRALANDKLAQWRARGWDVGIATGDIALNLDARIVVATLETQRARFLRGEGPGLLVVDEFQMLADDMRGVHYELALALAPKTTQLLLLSGSVANPGEVVAWLRRLGRDVLLVEHLERPVPLEARDLATLPDSQFVISRQTWPRLAGRAQRAELTPLLIFAPRRKAAEQIAQAIAAGLPLRDSLAITPEQEMIVGKQLARLLRQRVAYHHSGLSYAARAGVIEVLAQKGHLEVVVATMGLAAGINFSMRSVLITDRRYFAGNFEREVTPDELLQMFGRAGRRGFDEIGYALHTSDLPRLGDARPRQLRRPAQVDWPSMISVMHAAAERGEQPFAAATHLARSLFSAQPVSLGVERALATGARACGWWVGDERARYVRRGVVEILNSQGEWEIKPGAQSVKLGSLLVMRNDRWEPALRSPESLKDLGQGNICRLKELRLYGREVTVATILPANEFNLVRWLRREAKKKVIASPDFQREVVPILHGLLRPGRIVDFVQRGNNLVARLDFSDVMVEALVDTLGQALRDPQEREELPIECRTCDQLIHDQTVAIVGSITYAWRELGLIQPDGRPTPRGIIFSFFHGGEGLALAVALEDKSYPLADLVFDLANLRAGPRFSGEDAPMGGRLGILCQQTFARKDYPGYLTMGVPPQYGAGAAEVVRDLVIEGGSRHKWTSESLRHGDIERAVMEWRSVLRLIAAAPDYPLSRWRELKVLASDLAARAPGAMSIDLSPLHAGPRYRRLAP